MTKYNIWSISIIGLLFALLFTPLIVAQSLYFPYVTGKVFAFRGIVTLMMICWLILVINKPAFLPKKSTVLVISGIFVLWLVIANTFGIDPENSFYSNFERMEGWFTHVYLFFFLIIVSTILNTEKIWNQFLNASVIAANIIALFATFDSVSRTQIFLGNSTYVAVYVLFNLYFAALLVYRLGKRKIENISLKYVGILYYVFSILLFTYVIFRTQTRGTVLALGFSATLFLLLSVISYWKNKKVRIISLIFLGVMILSSVLFWQNRNSAFIQNNPLLVRVATISATEGTGKARLVNWGIALKGVKENPILGWGQENYSYVFAQKYDPQMYAQEPWFDRTHNAFLDWTIQGGIPALLLYMGLFIFGMYGIKVSTSLTRVEKNILISLFVAYGIHNIFVFDNYSSYLMFFVLLGFTIHHSQKEKIKIDWDKKTQQITVVLLIAVLMIVSFSTIIKPYSVAHELIETFKQTDGYKVTDLYKKILDKKSFGTTEAEIRLLGDSDSFLRVDNAEFKKTYLDLATRAGDDMIARGPKDVRRLEAYGSYLLGQNNIQKSIEIMERAQVLAPNRQNNLYVLGFGYLQNEQIDKAKEVFKHAYEVLPENVTAKTYYGAILLRTGDKNGKDLIGEYSYKDPTYLSIFTRTKQYKEVIKIREQLKKDNPTNYQNQVLLAAAYVLDGQKTKAIQNIKEVQKAVPEFKAQGDYLIKEILAGRKLTQ